MIFSRYRLILSFLLCIFASHPLLAQRQIETLNRGLIAVRKNSTQVYLGWRRFGNDPTNLAFNLYRSANGGSAIKLNTAPLSATTDYLDTPGSSNLTNNAYSYFVRPIFNGVEQGPSEIASLSVNPDQKQFFTLPLRTDTGPNGPYGVKFCWVGDLDGDGDYDFVVDRLSTLGTNEQFIEAYKNDGTFLWRMSMGPNSINQYSYEPGSSAISIGDTDNVTVYDMDGDGRAEVLVRTANGVSVTNAAGVQVASISAASNSSQFLSVIDGLSGSELGRAILPNAWAVHGTLTNKAMIAYLDGKRPSVVMYGYNRADTGAFYRQFTAWNFREGSLTQLWTLAQNPSVMPGSEGHQVRIADVDQDGKDEICDIGHVIDDDGKQLFNTELTHGDRFHIADINPDRPGLETFAIQQYNPTSLASALYESGTGKMIKKWYSNSSIDVGRGIALDISAAHKGYEMYTTQPGIFNAKGERIYTNNIWAPEGIWWDGDFGREFIDGAGSGAYSPTIDDFSEVDGTKFRLFSIYNDWGSYSTRQAYGGRPAFWGDLLGDWREEVVLIQSDYSALRIYTTHTSAAPNQIYTLMHNPQYRCQATTKGYVQASYVDYYLGFGMSAEVPPPPMADAQLTWASGSSWDIGVSASWKSASGGLATYAQGNSVLFDLSGSNASNIALSGAISPASLSFFNPQDFVIRGPGTLSGGMTFSKSGGGVTTLVDEHGFSGITTIWDGALQIDGRLSASPVRVWGGTWGGAEAKGRTGGRLAGSGTVSKAVTIGYRGAITPGAGMDSAGTLNLGDSLTLSDGAVLAFDLSDDPGGLAKANDRIQVAGNLSLSGVITLHVNPLNSSLQPGTYTLLTYGGALSGSISNLAVRVPEGTIHTVSIGQGAVTLTVPVTRAPAQLIWAGGLAGNVWDLHVTPNWLRSGSSDTFVSGDTIRFDSTGSTNGTVNLIGDLLTGGVTVDSHNDYQFSGGGSITGIAGLTKMGSGTLRLATTNSYTGPTLILGGTLSVENFGDAGIPSSMGAAGVTASNLVIDGGTLALTGLQSSTNRSITLGSAGGALSVPSATSLQISGQIVGGGSLTKIGAGTLILASSNSYGGGTLVAGGTLQLASDNANVNGLGGGLVTLRGGTLSMANNDDVSSAATSRWMIDVPGGAFGRLNADGRCTLAGSLTGSGDFTFFTPFVRTAITGNWSAFSGNIWVVSDADGGDFRIETTSGYQGARLDLGSQVSAYYNSTMASNLTLSIGTLSGAESSVLRGGATVGRTLTWQVGARNEDSTYAGVIGNGGSLTALTKIGTGTLVLSGANTYTGASNVVAGCLKIDGSTQGSAFIVQSGGTLGGSGTITGNVTVQAGGALEHGELGATPLTIVGDLTLPTSIVVRPSVTSLNSGTYTVLNYSGSLTGIPTFSWQAPVGTRLRATFDTSMPGVITMTLVELPRLPGMIEWTGIVDSNWDSIAENWSADGLPVIYQSGDSVHFGDGGNASSAINFVSNVQAPVVSVNASKNYTFSGSGVLIEGSSLEKSGSGILTLTRTHSFTGSTVISGGVLSITQTGGGSSAIGATLGTGEIVLSGGGDFRMGSLNGKNFPNHPIRLISDSGGTLSSVSLTNAYGGSISGDSASVFNLSGAISMGRTNFAQFGTFYGTVMIPSGSQLRFSSSSGANGNGGAATSFQVDGVINTRNSGGSGGVVLGALSGGGSLQGQGSTPSGTVTYFVGAMGLDSTFSGEFVNGSNGLTALHKLGVGTLTLSGISRHGGSTTISAGRLMVEGAIESSPTTVNVGGTLGGSGRLGATVSCNGTLTPGLDIGSISFGAGLNLSSTSVLDYQLGSQSDLVNVTGNLALDGTLRIAARDGFSAGTYTLIRYSGELVNRGLEIDSLPTGYLATLNTDLAGEVRLIVTAQNQAPDIVDGIIGGVSQIVTTSRALSVLASDDGGESNLIYTWSAEGPGTVSFSENSANLAKDTTVVFSMPGSYRIKVIVSDSGGLSVESSTVFEVEATAVSVMVMAPDRVTSVNDSLSFSAIVYDQFGVPMADSSLVWSASGGGTISEQGVFTAMQAGGPYQVSASQGGISGVRDLTIEKAAASVVLSGLAHSYDGLPKSASAITQPLGLDVVFSYNGSSELPNEVGTYEVVATVVDLNYAGSVNGSLVIDAPSIRDFNGWVAATFSTLQLAGGEAEATADPDGDGLVNLAEYALGSDPYSFTQQPQVSRTADSFSITFQRPRMLEDLTYHAEVSSNLRDWTGLSLEVLSGDSDRETVRGSYSIPSDGPVRSFIRLRFEK